MSSSTKIITVFGATGHQGAAVVKELKKHAFTTAGLSLVIRAITRDSTSSKAQSLLKMEGGAKIELVQANMDDSASLAEALKGADAVFVNTNTFDGGPELEVQRGKRLVDVAKQENVGLFLWSTLPRASKLSGGKYKHVEHFESKADVSDYLAQSGLKWVGVSTGFFAENLVTMNMATNVDEQTVKLSCSIVEKDSAWGWSWIDADLGPVVAGILNAHFSNTSAPKVFNQDVPVASFQGSFAQVMSIIESETGKRVTYEAKPPSGNPDMDEMFSTFKEVGMYNDGPLPRKELLDLGIKFSTLEEFVKSQILPKIA